MTTSTHAERTPVLDALWAVREEVIGRLSAAGRTPGMPKSPRARIALLHRRAGRNTRRVAELLGVHPETVRRYLRGQRKNPPADFAARLEREVHKALRPRLGKKADQEMCAKGLRVNVLAKFGFKTTDDRSSETRRERQLNEDLSKEATRALIAARDAAREDLANEITGQGIGDSYFQLQGADIDVHLSHILAITFEL
ncbi:telomere-protecting terminal protein Tpg [Streptomyces sp. NPDC020883]|uniref:telomere-protecting terminal protein Tpg n=1 Tax=Streptomyces sp. NPDC020883 TaxID=3365099 RepID=UPI0037ABAF60